MAKITKKMTEYLEKKFPNHIVAGDKALAAKKYDKAVEHYSELEKNNDLTQFTCFNWGKALLGLKMYVEAIEKFKQSIELEEKFDAAYIELGVTYYKLGHFEEADKVFKEASEKFPDLAPLYFHWALVKEPTGHIDEAVKLYKKAIELAPNDIMSNNALGKIYFMKNELDVAFQYFETVLKINSKFAPAYLSLAIIQNRRGFRARALDFLKKACELDPTAKVMAKRSEEFKNLENDIKYKEIMN